MEKKKSKSKIIILTSVIVGVLVVLLGLTYAIFSYSRLGSNGELVLGEIYMHYTETNVFSLDNAFPSETYNPAKYFEFTIEGKNTHEVGGILYNIQVTHGDENTSKTRINDNHLKFRLVEVNDDDTETVLVDGESYDVINNTTMYSNIIPKNTTTEVEYKYRVYVWISDEVTIGNTEGASYTQEEWANLYANVKINVTGEYTEGEIFSTKIKSKVGTEGLVAVNTSGTLYDGTGEIREYRYSGSGNYCTYTDGENDYNLNVEGETCPQTACMVSGALVSGDNDAFLLMGECTSEDVGGTVLSLKTNEVHDSGLRNYVEFNGELWRIIGVFGDNVKIMRDKGLEYNTYPDATYTSDNNISFMLKSPYLSSDVEIVSKYQWFTYNYTEDENYTNKNFNDWTNSGMMHYLNDTTTNSYYTSKLSTKAKNMIQETTYYLGNIKTNMDSALLEGTANEIYNNERGSEVCPDTVTSATHNNNCNIWNGNQATWTGDVALMYPSDYAYAASSNYWTTDIGTYFTSGVYANNWMLNTDAPAYWFLSPSSDYPEDASGVNYDGGVYASYVDIYISVRPSLNLKSSVVVVSGDGSYSNPYKLLG